MALIKGWRAGRGLQRAKGRHRCGGGGGGGRTGGI